MAHAADVTSRMPKGNGDAGAEQGADAFRRRAEVEIARIEKYLHGGGSI
jgi:hypothetical protein